MERYLAVVDILGFSDLVNNNSHKDLVSLYENFRIHIQKTLAKDKVRMDELNRAVFDVTNSTINSIIISDSVIFWSNSNTVEEFFDLIECIYSLLEFSHNTTKIYLRAALTFGNFYFDYSGIVKGKGSFLMHPLMVGKALVEAHEIQGSLKLIGGVITNESITNAESSDKVIFKQKWDQLLAENKIVHYLVPVKKGNKEYWTINWVQTLENPNEAQIRNGFSSYKKTVVDVDVKLKIENTIGYVNHIRDTILKNSVWR